VSGSDASSAASSATRPQRASLVRPSLLLSPNPRKQSLRRRRTAIVFVTTASGARLACAATCAPLASLIEDVALHFVQRQLAHLRQRSGLTLCRLLNVSYRLRVARCLRAADKMLKLYALRFAEREACAPYLVESACP